MDFDKSWLTVGAQTIIALAVTAAFIYAIVSNQPVPEHFQAVVGLIWGYYFAKNGGKIVPQIKG